MLRIFLLLGLSSVLIGCGILPQPVGGRCEYVTEMAEATVTEVHDKTIEVKVHTTTQYDNRGVVIYSRLPNRNDKIRVGDKVRVDLSKITKGACTPHVVRWPDEAALTDR